MESSAATRALGPALGGGTLPGWAPWGVVGISAAISAGVLAAAGSFTVAMTVVLTVIVSGAAIYFWSRAVEDARQAKNRLMTHSVVSAFGLAVLPLFSLLYEVIHRGIHRFDSAFFTESARGVIGE